MNLVVVIPAYNEERTVGEVVRKCRMQNAECRIIVIDDGSTDRTAQRAQEAGALVLHHPINRGLGAALATGMEGALFLVCHPEGAERPKDPVQSKTGFFTSLCSVQNDKQGIVVTLDADGQHDPQEIPALVEPILKGEAEVVIGSRWVHTKLRNSTKSTKQFRTFRSEAFVFSYVMRRIANIAGNFFTWVLFGIWVADSQY